MIDRYSRYVPSWRLSDTPEARLSPEAPGRGRPEIFNTDQGWQFASRGPTGRLEAAGLAVGGEGRGRGRGRAPDDVFVGRLWGGVRYEGIYIEDYEGVSEPESGLTAGFRFHDEERPDRSPGYRTPGEVARAGLGQANRGEGP